MDERRSCAKSTKLALQALQQTNSKKFNPTTEAVEKAKRLGYSIDIDELNEEKQALNQLTNETKNHRHLTHYNRNIYYDI